MEINLPFHIADDGKSGFIIAEKQFYTGKCILDVSAELASRFQISFDARTVPDAIVIQVAAVGNEVLTEANFRDFMNHLIDHQTWLDLNDRFESIREKIVAEAFAPLKKL